MARKRFEGTQLKSWEEVDDTLRRIGEIERDLMLIEGDTNHAIDELKAKAKTDSKPLQDQKAGLELAIKEFCEANRGEFLKVKTKQLVFGSVGFRLSTKVLIRKVGDTLQALKDLNLTACIRTKEEIDKEALKNLDGNTLATIGASLRTEDAFGYEIDRTRIPEAA
jgi:phage host-nuclease inhibitor protein Gam